MQPAGLLDVAQRLSALLADSPHERPRILPLSAGRAPRRVAAVDGSSVTLLESGSHSVVAYRAGGVLLESGAPVTLAPAPLRLAVTTDDDELARLRTAEEVALARLLLARLEPGDLLLFDGALSRGAEAVAADATALGIDAAGVCKSTSLTVGGVPAIAACQLAARGTGLATWSAALSPTMFVARLSAAEDRPFRFDVAAHDGDGVRVLGALAALAGHPGYPGYPSPLAMAHHAAVIADDERRRLASQVMEATLARGVREDAWRAAFLDYHDVLELGV